MDAIIVAAVISMLSRRITKRHLAASGVAISNDGIRCAYFDRGMGCWVAVNAAEYMSGDHLMRAMYAIYEGVILDDISVMDKRRNFGTLPQHYTYENEM